MVFAVGDEECKGHQQLVSFDAFARAMRVAATAAARMTTLEGVRDAVNILSDFESLFTQTRVFFHCPRMFNVHHKYGSDVSSQMFATTPSVQIHRLHTKQNQTLRRDRSFNSIAAKESNITADRVCLLMAALDYTDTESESQEDYSTTTSRDGENDAAARYVFSPGLFG